MDYEGVYQDLLLIRDRALCAPLFGVDFDEAFALAVECGEFRLSIERRELVD